MKGIAVYINKNGETVPIDQNGQFKVYKKDDQSWSIVSVHDFALSKEGGMGQIRQDLKTIGESLKCCSHIVASKISGLPYTILDGGGFQLWELEGRPEDFLDILYEKAKTDTEEEEASSSLMPKKLGEDGTYYLDLKSALKETNGQKSSKQILIPFLEAGDFYELKVLCSHIPPWFEKNLGTYGLVHEVVDRGYGEYTAVISHATCEA